MDQMRTRKGPDKTKKIQSKTCLTLYFTLTAMLGREVDARLLSSLSKGHKDTDEKTEERKRSAGNEKSNQAHCSFYFLTVISQEKAYKWTSFKIMVSPGTCGLTHFRRP